MQKTIELKLNAKDIVMMNGRKTYNIEQFGVFLIFSGLVPFSRKSPNSNDILTTLSSSLQQKYSSSSFFPAYLDSYRSKVEAL